jgi:hypothetical protein
MVNRLWSYTVGERKLNRIRVYERRPNGPLYIEFYNGTGRHQMSLTTATGVAIFDRELAKSIANSAASAQRKKREARVAHQLLGLPEPHTLSELLDKYWAARSAQWTVRSREDQVRIRQFWLTWLGPDRQLTDITPALAQAALRQAMRANNHLGPPSQVKYLTSLKSWFRHARTQLKWIGEHEDLEALGTPRVDSVSRPYTQEQVLRLLPATRQVDPRCAVLAHLAWISGRRATALRTLKASAYTRRGAYGVLHMPGETDKARKSGDVYLYGQVRELVEELLDQPAVKASGLLFPSGRLDDPAPRRKALGSMQSRTMLAEAEKLAGIKHVNGRAYHGIKRRFATTALAHDPQAAAKQSGTLRKTLEAAYEQDDPAPKQQLARYLDALIRPV